MSDTYQHPIAAHQCQCPSVSPYPVGRHIRLIPGTTETTVNCYRRASFVRQVAVAAEEEEIAVGVDEMPVDGFDLPPGMTSDEFSLYVAMDDDVQTAAEVTDELRAGQQAAGEVDADGEMSSEATGEEDDSMIASSNHHRSRCPTHCSVWIQYVRTWRWLTMTHTNDCMD